MSDKIKEFINNLDKKRINCIICKNKIIKIANHRYKCSSCDNVTCSFDTLYNTSIVSCKIDVLNNKQFDTISVIITENNIRNYFYKNGALILSNDIDVFSMTIKKISNIIITSLLLK